MRRRDKLTLLGIIILTAFAVASLTWPALGKWLDREEIRLGLDLQGGAHLVYEADLSEAENPEEAMKGVIAVIEKRINAYGVSEPLIQQMRDDRLLVQLPGIEEIDEAKKLIGQTALIRFKEMELDESSNPVLDEEGEPNWIPAMGKVDEEDKELTSQYFKGTVAVVLAPTTNLPEIAFEWDEEGAKLFEQITERLIQKPLGIFLGDEMISSPTVQTIIKERGVITGMSLDGARHLTVLLNAGRIPVPLHTIEEHDVSPTLGADFIRWSVIAGAIGLALVILFMILYYRLPGVMAGVALLIYAVLVLAAFKLIPVTLTLAGIAGFILSIGMAVDANVLIFERMKEEIRTGRTLRAAIEVGFNRAWPAIRDSNISTFITCGILYWMGSTLAVPSVMGFALTLFTGVAISMFSAIVITRTFLRLLGGTGVVNRPSLFVPASKEMMLSREGR
ncbi:MAG: protein translocase subunit SecD [Chloroflexi bacterium CG07_land_8_20_14_0_80_51_10]|nr:MAG: protein translocase subunit SecD [Chloroflexi bacterium CG07_land_8_20_14_0_80_51_10]